MILIDWSHSLHRNLHMNIEEITANPYFLSHLLISQALSFASLFGASKSNPIIIALDSSSWRKEYYIEEGQKKLPGYENQTYKGNRSKDSTIDWDTIYGISNKTTDLLQNSSEFIVLKTYNAEADDIIACLTNHYKNQETMWVCSSDKDFVQLQDKNVFIYDPLKRTFKPEQDIDLFKKIHIMIGDKGDNIFAIKPRVGEKTALKMLKDLDVLLQTDPDMKAKYIFNETLIDFDKIPKTVYSNIIKDYEEQKALNKFNAMDLSKGFMALKLSAHLENISKFKLSETPIKTKLNSYFDDVKKNLQTSESTLEEFFS